MQTSRVIHIVRCHAEGEVGDVIVGGVAAPPGDTLWQQREFLAQDQTLRNFVLNEPRGGVFRHVNLLVPPCHPDADMGFLIMEPEDTPPMSGSNSICVAAVLLQTGIFPVSEPETYLTLEAPGGLVRVTAQCDRGRPGRITITNVPSFAHQLDVSLEVQGVPTLTVDTAYGGDSFVIVDAKALGFELVQSEARELAELGTRIVQAANEQLGFRHPECDWDHVSFCQFAGLLERDEAGRICGRNAVAIRPGKIDRSPTGTGCSARMAVLHAKGQMKPDDVYIARSIIGSEFHCRIESLTKLSHVAAIVPSVAGRAWITGTSQLMLDPEDPWPGGYRLDDTWPGAIADER